MALKSFIPKNRTPSPQTTLIGVQLFSPGKCHRSFSISSARRCFSDQSSFPIFTLKQERLMILVSHWFDPCTISGQTPITPMSIRNSICSATVSWLDQLWNLAITRLWLETSKYGFHRDVGMSLAWHLFKYSKKKDLWLPERTIWVKYPIGSRKGAKSEVDLFQPEYVFRNTVSQTNTSLAPSKVWHCSSNPTWNHQQIKQLPTDSQCTSEL